MKKAIRIAIPTITMLAATAILVACSGKEGEVSFETQEQSRAIALDNATFNANVWRNANRPELKVMMRGDSTIGPDCNTGDGWASVDLVTDQGAHAVKLKCSTVSSTIGCMTEEDFKGRPSYIRSGWQLQHALTVPVAEDRQIITVK